MAAVAILNSNKSVILGPTNSCMVNYVFLQKKIVKLRCSEKIMFYSFYKVQLHKDASNAYM